VKFGTDYMAPGGNIMSGIENICNGICSLAMD